jgi:hypothetical protein
MSLNFFNEGLSMDESSLLNENIDASSNFLFHDKDSFFDNLNQPNFQEKYLFNDKESINAFPFPFPFPNPLQNDEYTNNLFLPKEIDEDKVKENANNDMNSTQPSSDKKGDNKIKLCSSKIKFKNCKIDSSQNLPSYYRLDMAKKHFKVQISQFATAKLNNLIEKSVLPNELKQSIHLPNSKEFTSKVTESFNYKCLSLSLREIFIIGKEKLQSQNNEYINKIFEYFKKFRTDNLPESLTKIKEFLEMNYEQLIIKFYDSSEFNIFKEDNRSIFFNDGIRAEKGFSVLENYGLIRLFKMIGRKRKRN